jgi:hypothetical protein
MNLADEVRRIVAADPAALSRPMSRNEDFRLPLHFAVLKNRPEMVALLLELGADPLAPDGSGYPAAAYATAPDVDRRMFETIAARGGTLDLLRSSGFSRPTRRARNPNALTLHRADGKVGLPEEAFCWSSGFCSDGSAPPPSWAEAPASAPILISARG